MKRTSLHHEVAKRVLGSSDAVTLSDVAMRSEA